MTRWGWGGVWAAIGWGMRDKMALSWFSCSVITEAVQVTWHQSRLPGAKPLFFSSHQHLRTSYYPNLKCLPQVAEGQGVATAVIQHPLWLPTRGLCQRPN